MAALGNIIHGVVAAVFVTAGLLGAIYAPPGTPMAIPVPVPAPAAAAASVPFEGANLIRAYLAPENLLMWSLLLTVWLMVALDSLGQWIDPSEEPSLAQGKPPLRRFYVAALLIAGAAPWLLRDNPAGMALAMGLAAWAAIVAARRAAGRHRPAVGFVAGWLTAILSAALAVMAAKQFEMPLALVSAIAILPAAAIGMAAQIWIGPSIGYSAALIWAFCGVAITTMGTDPLIALSAIIGISSMAVVLVRAAS